MTEMVENAGGSRRRWSAGDCRPDTGYGNELNVTRTVREYERRGVAGIHLEDQGSPKRCGHLDNKGIVDRSTYLARSARRPRPGRTEFVIIARTDARAVLGLDEAAGAPTRHSTPEPTWPSSKRRRPSKRSPQCRSG